MRPPNDMSTLPRFFLAIAVLSLALPAAAQETPVAKPDGVLVILDMSGSMDGTLSDGRRKLDVVRLVLRNFFDMEFEDREIGVRVFGHRREGDCTDTELLVPFETPEIALVYLRQRAQTLRPNGKTLISHSLRAAREEDFAHRVGDIVLVVDGAETCAEDPCDVVREWGEQDVSIRVHVVGLGLRGSSRKAMECISEAAGTTYYDVQSLDDLRAIFKTIHQRASDREVWLVGRDENGSELPIRGSLMDADGRLIEVSSGRRNVVAPGEYVLEAGVETRNGNLYRPVAVSIAVEEDESIEVVVPVPPRVSARFVVGNRDHAGSRVRAYRDGKELFAFGAAEEVFLDEGSYEFRAQPNPENDLRVSESFGPGDNKQILFEMQHTVLVKVDMVAAGSGIRFDQNYELWQGGAKVYDVHTRNGARVVPGLYDVRLPDRITPYVHRGITVTDEDEQHFLINVPVGHVTVIYQKADGSPDAPDRVFVSRGADGREQIFKNSGEGIPLVAGTYNVVGWSHKGDYEKVVFEIREGEDIQIVLRARE